ncbi:MAG: hypothetical protein JXA03_08835 [Bacteroidales bacterium]|nr:hypothetical protein [Bacteroidales bacterium]
MLNKALSILIIYIVVFLDPNEDFKRALNVNLTPHYFIFDGHKNVIYQKAGFLQGDEVEIQEVLDRITMD